MSKELAKTYDPKGLEDRLYQKWLDSGYFHAKVNKAKKPFTIVMPPPNVTGQLHMGHALDETMQDILIRFKRMQGYEALWQPGTDHAAIATEVKVINKLKEQGIDKNEIDYVIDCCEEACGDMNQRGGGNFAKAAAEVAGLLNATGSDSRGFCAGPSHALIEAAALVKSGAYKCVAVTAGGCTAKLGMNGKDHVKKGLPILEDCLGGFCVIIAENDGVNPEINLDILGRHTVGTGSAPQNVIGSLVADPLERAGLKITDIDKFSPEMQNPDITKPAGAGDVPLANYKMIAALAVKRGELDRKELASFAGEHGLTGWAPTQGHIPSGVPYIGFAREDILAGKINKVMIIGKGSLFLGRMTNLFDGVSFVIQANTGAEDNSGVSEEEVKGLIAKAMKDFAASLMATEE